LNEETKSTEFAGCAPDSFPVVDAAVALIFPRNSREVKMRAIRAQLVFGFVWSPNRRNLQSTSQIFITRMPSISDALDDIPTCITESQFKSIAHFLHHLLKSTKAEYQEHIRHLGSGPLSKSFSMQTPTRSTEMSNAEGQGSIFPSI